MARFDWAKVGIGVDGFKEDGFVLDHPSIGEEGRVEWTTEEEGTG